MEINLIWLKPKYILDIYMDLGISGDNMDTNIYIESLLAIQSMIRTVNFLAISTLAREKVNNLLLIYTHWKNGSIIKG